MRSRVDSDQGSQLEETITTLATQIDQLKRTNQAVGSDSVVMKLNQTANTADASSSIAAFATKSWRVTFTPTYMKNAYASFRYDLTITGGNGYEVSQYYPSVTNTTDAACSWDIAVTADANTCTGALKFYVLAPDGGTITVVAL